MKKIYRKTERGFERLTTVAMAVLGNSVAFIVVFCIVLFWLTNNKLLGVDIHSIVGDLILGLTFLSLFIIQKSFTRFSALLHLKVNELVASHEPASNSVISAEGKTDLEISELSKAYSELAIAKKEGGVADAGTGL